MAEIGRPCRARTWRRMKRGFATPVRRGMPWLFLIAWSLFLAGELDAAPFDRSHQAFAELLNQRVHDGLVDYAALKTQPKLLDDYLTTLAGISEDGFKRWPEKERLAFLINLYNATTLKLIVDHYPVKSIKDIGSFLKGPWDRPVVSVFGRRLTLNDLEHKILRVDYREPRIHFALVCAAKGCPPLRSEAYFADRLDAQLTDQARRFLADPVKNRVAPGERAVYLSPLFKWYGADFEAASGSVLAALKPYWPAAAAALVEDNFKIRYTDYDWSLNEARSK